MTRLNTTGIMLSLSLLPVALLALPDDLNQDLLTSCPALSESFLDQGLEICRGTRSPAG